MKVIVEEVPILERTLAGKLRAVVSRMPRERRGEAPEP
jgi:hypothetical protein